MCLQLHLFKASKQDRRCFRPAGLDRVLGRASRPDWLISSCGSETPPGTLLILFLFLFLFYFPCSRIPTPLGLGSGAALKRFSWATTIPEAQCQVVILLKSGVWPVHPINAFRSVSIEYMVIIFVTLDMKLNKMPAPPMAL